LKFYSFFLRISSVNATVKYLHRRSQLQQKLKKIHNTANIAVFEVLVPASGRCHDIVSIYCSASLYIYVCICMRVCVCVCQRSPSLGGYSGYHVPDDVQSTRSDDTSRPHSQSNPGISHSLGDNNSDAGLLTLYFLSQRRFFAVNATGSR